MTRSRRERMWMMWKNYKSGAPVIIALAGLAITSAAVIAYTILHKTCGSKTPDNEIYESEESTPIDGQETGSDGETLLNPPAPPAPIASEAPDVIAAISKNSHLGSGGDVEDDHGLETTITSQQPSSTITVRRDQSDYPVTGERAGDEKPGEPITSCGAVETDRDDHTGDSADDGYKTVCIVCGRVLDHDKPYATDGNTDHWDCNVHGGLELTSKGEYGSSYWDEDGTGSRLSVIVCDDCLREHEDRLHVRMGSGWTKPITVNEYENEWSDRLNDLKTTLNSDGASWIHWNDSESRLVSTVNHPRRRKSSTMIDDVSTVKRSNWRSSLSLLDAFGLPDGEAVPDDLLLPGDVGQIINVNTELTRAVEHSLRFYADLILRMRCEIIGGASGEHGIGRGHDQETAGEWVDALYERLKDELAQSGIVAWASKTGSKIMFVLCGSTSADDRADAEEKLSRCACILEDLEDLYVFVDGEYRDSEHYAVVFRAIEDKNPHHQAMVRLEYPLSVQ